MKSKLQTILNQTLFVPTTVGQIAFFRAIYCILIGYHIWGESAFRSNVLLQAPAIEYFLLIGQLLSLGFAAVGHRISMWSSLIFYIAIQSQTSFAINPHYNIVPIFALFILALSHQYGRSSWKNLSLVTEGWGLQLIKLTLGCIYFSAFCAKIINGGYGWLDGSVMTHNFLERNLVMNSELPLYIAQLPWLCVVLGWAALAFEGLFWTVIFSRRFEILYLGSSVLFHISILLTMGLDFSYFFGPTFLVLFPFYKVYSIVKQRFIPQTTT